ncbi:MAG: S-layer homology domain-containing protein [Bacillota bacterium]|nr:S-layer homology domain-containing protein [Bacillota bacterium]
MRRLALALLAALLALLLVGAFGAPAVQAAALSDLKDSWAKADIQQLLDRGVVNGYPDGTFRPQRSITRAEFAKLMSKAFRIDPVDGESPFSDTQGHWARRYITALVNAKIIQGYEDGTFRPNRSVSRAEVIAMVTRAIKAADKGDQLTGDWPPSYADVTADHWAFLPVEVGSRLGLVPSYIQVKFEPETKATRADAAHVVRVAMDLVPVKGQVVAVDPMNNAFTVKPDLGEQRLFTLPFDALLFRNGTISDLQNFTAGDQVLVLTGTEGQPRLVKAVGLVTKADLSNRVAALTKGLLTADQVAALMSGDKEAVSGSMKASLYNQLIGYGLSPEEVEAILDKNWQNLQGLSQERAAASLAQRLNLPAEVVGALLTRDWNQLQQALQIELTSQLLARLF